MTALASLLALGFTLAVPAAAAAPGSAGPAAIESLVKEGKLDEAVTAARAAVQAKPDDPDARLAAAHALAAKARHIERVVDVNVKAADVKAGRVVIPKYSTDMPTRLEVGYDSAMFEEALLHLSEGIRRAPQRKDLRLNQIYLLTDASRIDRAATALREAIAALPRSPGLAEELEAFGAERAKRNDAEGGAILLGIVAMAFPASGQVQADYSFTLARLGRKREAFAAMDHATAATADLKTHRMAATVGLVLRDFSRAHASYTAAYAISNAEEDHLGAAVSSYGVDPTAASAELLRMAQPAASSDPSVVPLAAMFLKAAEDGPLSSTTIDLAKNLIANHQEMLAIPLLDRILVAKPGHPEATKLLADLYDGLGCPKLAAALRPAPPKVKAAK
jgi:tetratricopeptide (TPR) repeat protein